MDFVATRLQMEIGMFFSVLDPEKFKEIGDILFGGPRTQKNLRKMTKKRSSEIQKFSQENVKNVWWSANRDKICQVVRESEKVEKRFGTRFPGALSLETFLTLYTDAIYKHGGHNSQLYVNS